MRGIAGRFRSRSVRSSAMTGAGGGSGCATSAVSGGSSTASGSGAETAAGAAATPEEIAARAAVASQVAAGRVASVGALRHRLRETTASRAVGTSGRLAVTDGGGSSRCAYITADVRVLLEGTASRTRPGSRFQHRHRGSTRQCAGRRPLPSICSGADVVDRADELAGRGKALLPRQRVLGERRSR